MTARHGQSETASNSLQRPTTAYNILQEPTTRSLLTVKMPLVQAMDRQRRSELLEELLGSLLTDNKRGQGSLEALADAMTGQGPGKLTLQCLRVMANLKLPQTAYNGLQQPDNSLQHMTRA